MYKEGKAGALCSFEVDKLTSDKDESNVNGHAGSRQIDLDSSILFNMPRPQRSLFKQRGHFVTAPLLKLLSKYTNSHAYKHGQSAQ